MNALNIKEIPHEAIVFTQKRSQDLRTASICSVHQRKIVRLPP
jgi:hypothetical protein